MTSAIRCRESSASRVRVISTGIKGFATTTWTDALRDWTKTRIGGRGRCLTPTGLGGFGAGLNCGSEDACHHVKGNDFVEVKHQDRLRAGFLTSGLLYSRRRTRCWILARCAVATYVDRLLVHRFPHILANDSWIEPFAQDLYRFFTVSVWRLAWFRASCGRSRDSRDGMVFLFATSSGLDGWSRPK